jgi:heme exporter protein B
VTSSRDAFRAIVAKDLRIELRTLRSIPAMALFAVTTFVLFHFTFGDLAESGDGAAGVLLVTVLFAAILAINRLFVPEREEGGFELVRLAPVDRSVLFAAKFTVLFVYLVILELIAVPIFTLFFLNSLDVDEIAGIVVVLLLMDLGLAATGTLVSSIATNSSARDLLVPLILLPMLIPLVIGSGSLLGDALTIGFWSGTDLGKWLGVLCLYDSIFILIGYAVFDFLLED